MAVAFRSHREWVFDSEPDELWDLITRTQDYQAWWPWLRGFETSDGFRQHSRWECQVAPPLPYVVRFAISFDEVQPAERVRTTVSGDVRGVAELKLSSNGGGSVATLSSELAPANVLLRRVASVARPLVEWGHDWVLDTGLRQFLEHSRAL